MRISDWSSDVCSSDLITTDLRLNEPRFIKLPDIMKAKSKPLESISFADLGVDSGDTLKTTHYAPPPKRSRGVMVKDAAELVAALKQKGLDRKSTRLNYSHLSAPRLLSFH